MNCGMYEVVITPPLGSPVPGQLHERTATGIKDDLYAKALVIESDDKFVVFIGVDALFVSGSVVEDVRKRLEQKLGLAPENVMISATHTHTGPPIRYGLDGAGSDEYLSFLTDRLVDVSVLAYHGRKPARIGVGSGHEADISFNRRYYMKDGSIMTNPGFGNDQIVRPVGPKDPEVHVLRVDDLDGNPLGVVVNFACHTDTVGGSDISGDYPGEMSRMIKQVLGDDVVSLFMLGACGDINHHDFMHATERQTYDVMGRILAAEVLKVREKIKCVTSAPLYTARSYHKMALRKPTAEQIEEAKKILQSDNQTEHFFARHILKTAEMTDHGAIAEIQAIAIGNWAFAGLPGEIFVNFGLTLKERSPFTHMFVNTICNGSIYGYVCTAEAYEQGGYEPRLKTNSRFPYDTGDKLVENALQLLQNM